MAEHCAHCGTPTPSSMRLCDPCLRAWTVSLRRAQGLPDTVEDPAIVSLLRRIVRGAARRMAPAIDEAADTSPSAPSGHATGESRLSRRG